MPKQSAIGEIHFNNNRGSVDITFYVNGKNVETNEFNTGALKQSNNIVGGSMSCYNA